jgi:hypothetical protein
MKMQTKKLAAGSVLALVFTASSVSFQNCSGGFTPLANSSLDLDSSLSTGPAGSLPPVAQLPVPIPVGGTITDLKIESTSGADQTNIPITAGQVFAPGSLLPSDLLVAKISDGSVLPLQMDVKAKHGDGSVRHAILSMLLPKLAAGQALTLALTKATGTRAASVLVPQSLVNANFTTSVRVNLGGTIYTASAQDLLKSGTAKSWLSGGITDEWLVSAPLKNAAGVAHPHLTARFAVRAFAGTNNGKVDVVLENNWAYALGPQNFIYDLEVFVGGKSVYAKAALNHLHHARWRKSFWWGVAPQAHVRHNTAYLISTRAVPNYDQSIPISEGNLAGLKKNFIEENFAPMKTGTITPYMPTTGGRDDIGLMPAWAVTYILSMDKRAKDITLGNADMSGSFPAHFRDQITDQPLSVVDFPYSTLVGHEGDAFNPVTKKSEFLPACGGVCDPGGLVPDVSHLPNLAYLPYMLTGDYFYLEELQFWASYIAFGSNPYYRFFEKGLMIGEQLRGQGWGLRILSETAYITPDTDRLKNHFVSIVNANFDWYNANYTNNPNANVLGTIINGYSISYNNSRGVAPWMDDFFTQAVGHAAELGFTKAQPLLAWKAKFQVGRMLAPGFCWISGGIYALNIRDSETSPFYTTLKQAYQASEDAKAIALPCGGAEMAAVFGLKVGEMTGYSPSYAGFPSNYQPALAYSVDVGAPDAAKAWSIFMARTVKPDYQNGPQFSIVPRR